MKDLENQEFIDSISVLAGNPTEQELAAVIAVLLEARKKELRLSKSSVSSWAKNNAMLRDSLIVGNGQWGPSFRARN
jgi:Iap family predicted aminopeptidase